MVVLLPMGLSALVPPGPWVYDVSMLGAIVSLNAPDYYIHWGFILISLANFLVIVAMLVLFVLALTLPFIHSRHTHRRSSPSTEASSAPSASLMSVPTLTPGDHPPSPVPTSWVEGSSPSGASGNYPAAQEPRAPDTAASPGEPALWTQRLRGLWLTRLPPEKLLPDSQPAYVASWIYVFGVLTLAGFVVACLSGLVLALEGPVWWHSSTVGHFFNSLHLWSVECFMGFMAIHLWGKFWMASWRGKRALTWMTGVVAFLVSVFEAFTGYLSQTNFDSQWIAFEAKDAMNSAGIGAFFNTMNFGQALMLHIVFVPLVLAIIIAIHIVMVRLRGVVHPIDANPEHLGTIDGIAGAPPRASQSDDVHKPGELEDLLSGVSGPSAGSRQSRIDEAAPMKSGHLSQPPSLPVNTPAAVLRNEITSEV